MPGVGKNVLSLKQFMLRQEVLNLYRNVFRSLRKVEDTAERKSLEDWARSEFRAHTSHTDEESIKHLLQYGKKMLQEYESSVGRAK